MGRIFHVDLLSVFFGIGTWVCVNGLWVQLPLFVQKLPERWALPSYLSVIIQLANVGPILYTILNSFYPKFITEVKSTYVIMFIGCISTILLSFFWDKTLVVFGVNRSVALFILVFWLAFVDCSSRVLYLPFMAKFKEIYLTSFFIGEGLSGFIPSIFALVQGVGGNPECVNVTVTVESSTETSWKLEAYTPDPLFSVETFFLLLLAITILSWVAFYLLNQPKIVKSALSEKTLAENLLNEHTNFKSYNSTTNLQLQENQIKNYENIDENTKEEEISETNFGKIISSNNNLVVDNSGSDSSVTVEDTLNKSIFFYLLTVQALVCFLANGVFPSIQSYSCLPYGNVAYHWAVTLSNISNPTVCFLTFYIPKPTKESITSVGILAIGVSMYVMTTAVKSPNPPLVGLKIGEVLLILSWILLVGLFTYVKISIATVLRSEGKRGLFFCGAITQLGSALGAIVTFFLVNFEDIFQSYFPCQDMSMSTASTVHDKVLRKRSRFVHQRSLSQYAVSLPNQPTDISGVHPKDDRFRFFKKGRDLQSYREKHHFTEEEIEVLKTYESESILPSQSQVYRSWLESLPPRSDSETWTLVAIIALLVGVLAFAIKETCEKLQIFYNPIIPHNLKERGDNFSLWLYYASISCICAFCSAFICVFICPYSAGSGLPEIIGILNGVVVRNMLTFKNLICKVFSSIFTVLSALPVGFEGPMIHIGALIASTLARPIDCNCCSRKEKSKVKPYSSSSEKINQGKSGCSNVCRYRDCQERHNLICVGAAAGIAAAFSAPITGLTFAMEEMSSFWSSTLTWQTFVCAILARAVTEVLRSITSTLHHHPEGKFRIDLTESALFDMKELLILNILILIPTCIIGIFGGLLGSFYIFIYLKFARFRRKILSKISKEPILNLVKVIEPVLIAIIVSAAIMGTLPYYKCYDLNYTSKVTNPSEGKYMIFHSYKCSTPRSLNFTGDHAEQTGQYHEAATLFFGSWEQMIRNLFSRRTPLVFGLPILAIIFVIFFIFSIWASQCSIASGLLVPHLAIGALYGRFFGRIIYDTFIPFYKGDNLAGIKDWLDPGAYALLGSASFLAGTTRLPITSVVLMIEMTNDINMSLLIMIVVMLSKFIGDLMTHPLYHSMLEFKCIPYLESELKIYVGRQKVNLELFKAEDVMSKPVHCVNIKESLQILANLLLDTNHGGFPVLLPVPEGQSHAKKFVGIITRLELSILLTKTESFEAKDLIREDIDRIRISYPEYSSNKLKDTLEANQLLNAYATESKYKDVFVNLYPYMNASAFKVSTRHSLHRVYLMFRTLGLRHLVVCDHSNQVVGIITRKDLMGFTVDEKIKRIIRNSGQQDSYRTIATRTYSNLPSVIDMDETIGRTYTYNEEDGKND